MESAGREAQNSLASPRRVNETEGRRRIGFQGHTFLQLSNAGKAGVAIVAVSGLACGANFKGKIFRSSTILEALPKQGMSYTWRSILRGVELMKKRDGVACG